MGASLSWLAVKGKSPEAVCNELELRSTGQSAVPGTCPFAASASDAGWYLIVARRCEHHIISAPVAERISRGCEALTCTVEEHVMFSEATGWRDGQRLWALTHKGEDGPKGIAEQGSLPAEYPALRDRFVSEQESEGGADAEVDFLFELPVVLVGTLTGYRHDDASPAYETRGFELLESTKKSWFQRLFSK